MLNNSNARSHHLTNIPLPDDVDTMVIGQFFLDPEVANANDATINELKHVYEARRTFLEKLVEARRNTNPRLTAEENFMRVFDQKEQRQAQIAKQSDAAQTRANERLKEIDRDIEAELELREPEAGKEIRAYFSSLDPNERMPTLLKRLQAGDKETLAAVTTQQAYLSGLTDEQVALLRAQNAETNAPHNYARRKALKKALTYHLDGSTKFIVDTAKLFPAETVKAIKSKSKAADDINESIRNGF